MNWNQYRQEIDRADFDPDFPRRALRNVEQARQSRKENRTMKRTHRTLRAAVLAACILILAAATAFAIHMNSRETAANALNIQKGNPIPQYTEFDPPKETAPDSGVPAASLVSVLSSGDTVIASVELRPLDAVWQGYALEDCTSHYELELDGEGFSSWALRILSCDPETRTALAQVTMHGVDTETVTALALRFRVVQEDIPGEIIPLTVPVAPGGTSSAVLDLELATQYGRAQITQAVVGATYVRVDYVIPAHETWEGYVPYSWEKREAGIPQEEFVNAFREYTMPWFDGADAFLRDAALVYADGRTAEILSLPSQYQYAFWAPPETGSYENWTDLTATYRFDQALDLREITGIRIAGTIYPLTAPAE